MIVNRIISNFAMLERQRFLIVNRKDIFRIGIDVGSTTAKIVVLDASNEIIFSQYKRHNAQVGALVAEYFKDICKLIGSHPVKICVTGSVGMAIAEQLRAPFLQEVVAATEYARIAHPEAKCLIDIGGEDAKVVLFDKHNTQLRMNGNCAGGTGAFIDQMTVLMGVDNTRLNELALHANHFYPMASRCGVFAKTDVQNLMARNVCKEDIAASIFHSIAVETITTLAHGAVYEAPILLCGGPLTFMSALRKAIADYLGLDEDKDFIISKQANLIPAIGCAFHAGQIIGSRDDDNEVSTIEQLIKRLDSQTHVQWHSNLKPLFNDDTAYKTWKEQKARYTTNKQPIRSNATEKVFIGIDSGSTTTKIIALREDNSIAFSYYAMNLGNPIVAAKKGLEQLLEEATAKGTNIKVIGAVSTGYGEELIKNAFNLDEGMIETIAHFVAAKQLKPNVSFILDIGGQDMKAIFVEQGTVVRMELNEACSSGCGTFIQTFANNLNMDIANFADAACHADAPCDLGTRCTVFMNSKVKQVMREGATVADISAGLSYSVIKNCLYKVLKLHGNDSLGEEIVVQGGTMRNDAVVRAFEVMTGRDVARSDMPELMGALGCALHAKELNTNKEREINELLASADYTTRETQCKGCSNQCRVMQYHFAGGGRFYSGNKCERIFNNYAKGTQIGRNIYTTKERLLFGGATTTSTIIHEASSTPDLVVAIPRVLGLYEDFPFWQALFTSCGIKVVLSSDSSFHKYEQQLNSVMSDNICFPAKLVHSHIYELDQWLSTINAKDKRIFFPYVVFEKKEDARTDNSFNCPIVTAYSDVIRNSMALKNEMDSPVITFANRQLLQKQIMRYLKTWGINKKLIYTAFKEACQAQDDYNAKLVAENKAILEEARKKNQLIILLAGRPYHTDPLIQHRLSDMIASMGVCVISDDIVRGDYNTEARGTQLVEQWAYTNRIIKAAQWAANQPQDVHFVEMTSFGCGPDAFVQDDVRDILKRNGKPFTLLKIDDVSNTGSLKLRIRSLIDSLMIKNESGKKHPFIKTKVFHKEDVRRTILAPFFTEFLSPLLPPLLKLAGYNLETLPMSDAQSAEEGLAYANNEVCYPATLIVGDMIKALKSGKYNPDDIAFVMTQTGGQCRATNYTALIKRAFIANGFTDVPLITLGVSTEGGDNEQDGFKFPWIKLSNITTNTLLYCDALAKLYYPSVVREKKPNAAKTLKQKYTNLAIERIAKNDAKGLVSLIHEAATEFASICSDKKCGQVGLVGEIFLKFNPYSHQFLEEQLIKKGIEIVPPLITPFFVQDFVNIEVQEKECLKENKIPTVILHAVYKLIEHRQNVFNKAAKAFPYFREFTSIYDDAEGAKGVVNLSAQFGEGWLLPAEITAFYKDGIKNVISLQPFGCIANHIISKGIEKKLHEKYPDLNFLSLDFDSGVSATNVENRLLLFLNNLQQAL